MKVVPKEFMQDAHHWLIFAWTLCLYCQKSRYVIIVLSSHLCDDFRRRQRKAEKILMFGQNRQQLRQYYHDVWHKLQLNSPLSSLENSNSKKSLMITLNTTIFSKVMPVLEQEYFVEQGQTKPPIFI